MDAATRNFVFQRAEARCEYCRMPQDATPLKTFHVEHIIASQHLGSDEPDNLCLACDRCNGYKGPNLSSIDPDTGIVMELFNPRLQVWADHFEFEGARIVGKTPIGRATLRLLQFNAPRRIELRQAMLDEGKTL